MFYISDKGVADELYSGRIRPIRLASLMVSGNTENVMRLQNVIVLVHNEYMT